MGQHSSSWPCGCGRTMKSFLQGSTWLLPGQPGAKSRRQVNQAVCCVVSSGAASPLPRPWDLLVLLLCQLCPSHTRATPRHCLMARLHPPSWCPHFRAQPRKSDCSQKWRAPLPILKNQETLLKKNNSDFWLLSKKIPSKKHLVATAFLLEHLEGPAAPPRGACARHSPQSPPLSVTSQERFLCSEPLREVAE